MVDAVRLRGRVGVDEVLRRCRRRPGASPGDLLRLARGATQFGVESIIWAAVGTFAAVALYRQGTNLRSR